MQTLYGRYVLQISKYYIFWSLLLLVLHFVQYGFQTGSTVNRLVFGITAIGLVAFIIVVQDEYRSYINSQYTAVVNHAGPVAHSDDP